MSTASTAWTRPLALLALPDDALVDEAAAVAERAGARLRLPADHTVVALAGATGSGKSSTFNAVTGLEWPPPPAYAVLPRRGRWPAPGAPTARPSCSTGSAS